MSRCFPFPPPGYEKKLRVEDVTLLAKEKDKVKKEKKRKKDTDKEKKEGREKDKERSKEKEKHKHKDRDEKNGKKRSQSEKSIEGDRFNVEKAGSNSPQSFRVQELDQRIGFVSGAPGSQIVHKVYDRDNGQSNIPKIAFVFNNGAEQRTVQKGAPLENNINKPTEGKETQKHHSSSKKREKSKDKNAKRHKGQAEVCTQQTFVYDGPQNDPPKEAAVVQEFERRIRDENGASGSQVSTNANVTIHKRSQNYGKVGNGYAISFSQTKEKSKFGNGSYSTENGQINDSKSKVPVVGVVHNFKVEEKGCDLAGGVDSKKAPVEGVERNGYSGKTALDNRKKIQSKDEDRNKPRKEVKVKEEADSIVGLSRLGQNGSDSTDSSTQFTFKMGNKTPEAIIGKRKEPEANGILYDNMTRPSKFQKTVISSQLAAENGRHLKSGTTITLSASKQGPANCFNKLNGEEHRSLPAQSPPVTTNSPPASLKPMGPSPLRTTQPPISAKLNGSPFGPSKSHSFVGKVPGVTGCQESSLVSPKPQLTAEKFSGAHETVGRQDLAKPSSTAVKVNGTHTTVGYQDSAKPPLTAGKVNGAHETVGFQGSAKPPLIAGKVNGIIKAHGSPAVTLKHPSSSGKGTVGFQGSAKPPSTAGKVNGTIEAHGAPVVTLKHPSSSGKETVGFQGSAKPPSTAGKVNGTIEAHGAPAVTLKHPSSSGKGTVGFQGSAEPPSTAGKVNGTIEAHGSPPVTLKRPSSSGKEKKHKDKSSKSKTLPPHPDTKYLSEILSVPKMEELFEFDNPEWLFENKKISLKDSDELSDRDNREQVWAKAIHIESADVYALPYVIPY